MRKFAAILALGIFAALPAFAADPHAKDGDITVFDPDRDIQPRLLSHDSTTMDNRNDQIPTTESRTDEPVNPSLVNPDTFKTMPDKSKSSSSDSQ